MACQTEELCCSSASSRYVVFPRFPWTKFRLILSLLLWDNFLSIWIGIKGLPLICLIRLCPFRTLELARPLSSFLRKERMLISYLPHWSSLSKCLFRLHLAFTYSNLFFASLTTSCTLTHFLIATLATAPKLFLHVFIGSRVFRLSSSPGLDRFTVILNILYIISSALLGGFVSIYLYRTAMAEAGAISLEDEQRGSLLPRTTDDTSAGSAPQWQVEFEEFVVDEEDEDLKDPEAPLVHRPWKSSIKSSSLYHSLLWRLDYTCLCGVQWFDYFPYLEIHNQRLPNQDFCLLVVDILMMR